MLVNIGPILIAVFAGLLLGEGFPRWLVIGITVAFAGVVLIGLATRSAEPTSSACPVRRRRGHLRRRGGGAEAVAAPAAGPAGHLHGLCHGRAVLPAVGRRTGRRPRRRAGGSVLGMVYLGRSPPRWRSAPGPTPCAGWTPAARVTTYVVPPLVILLGWLLLDEVPPALALVGGVVCLAGVALSRRGERDPRACW